MDLDPSQVRYDLDPRRPTEAYLLTIAGEARPFAMAEVFRAPKQWGVRLQDARPDVAEHDLLACVRHLLTWVCGCTAETVDVVLGRTHDHIMLLRVGGEYV